MWKKIVGIIFIFYILALLQNSFFAHFSLLGSIPNLVFIFFFLLVFFEKKDKNGRMDNNYWIIFLAVTAGFFLDIFSYSYLGPSILLLMVLGVLLKKIQLLLKNRENNYPFVYFLPLFIFFILVYDLLIWLYFYFLDPSKIILSFGSKTVYAVIYDLLIATVFFYTYKKTLSLKSNFR